MDGVPHMRITSRWSLSIPPFNFSGKDRVANTLHRHMTIVDDKRTYDISRTIVEDIIRDMFFNDAWDSVPGCKRLRTFCGGLATVFPNTTSVESDFSILKWELDEFRSSLMHLSVEGAIQAKQRSLLKKLWE